MKVAIVLNSSWNIVNFRMGLVRALQESGHEVFAIAPRDSYSNKLIDNNCHYVPIKMDSRGVNPLKDFLLTLELFNTYRKIKPDIILHFTVKPNVYGTIAANFLKIPVINNVCGLGSGFLKKGFITYVIKILYKLSFKLSSKVFFQNYEDCRLFVKNKLVKEEITDILPGSGINIAQFKPVQYKKTKSFTFLLVSRIIKDKGIMEYIEAIKILKPDHPHFKFQILGAIDEHHRHGISRKLIENWIAEGVFEYLGTVDDVRDTIDQAHCVVLPSYREGTPRTLLEAASMAKPIVTTRAAGCTNVVEDGYNGLLCRPRDAKDLAAKLKQMAEKSESELREMGMSGRKKIEKYFDESIVIDKYFKSISEISRNV